MSITTLLSNVPNLFKVLSLSAAVGTGGAVLASSDTPSPMDTTPLVSAAAAEPGMSDVLESLPPEALEAMPTPEMTEAGISGEARERGPGHATGLDRAAERANEHAAHGHARARAAHVRNAERRAERGARGSESAREQRAAERAERREARPERGSVSAREDRAAERPERDSEAHGRAIAAERRTGRGPF